METINDIVCEMRKDIPRVVDTKVILRNYADRIEAARKREREMIKRQESQKAQARKNARKQRARELTKARELEIKKANASPRLHPCGDVARLSAS